MATYKIIDLGDPIANQDAVTKNYVDTGLNTKLNSNVTLNNIVAPISSVNANNQGIINLADPLLAQDAATKNYIDTKPLDSIATPVSSVNLNNNKIVNIANPTTD
jgi:hypothetical protein